MASIRRAPRTRKWEVRYRDKAGRQRTMTCATKADANAVKSQVETDLRRGVWIDPAFGRVTFEAFVEASFRPTRIGLEPTTNSRDESYLRTHILPVFGHLPIALNRLPDVSGVGERTCHAARLRQRQSKRRR